MLIRKIGLLTSISRILLLTSSISMNSTKWIWAATKSSSKKSQVWRLTMEVCLSTTRRKAATFLWRPSFPNLLLRNSWKQICKIIRSCLSITLPKARYSWDHARIGSKRIRATVYDDVYWINNTNIYLDSYIKYKYNNLWPKKKEHLRASRTSHIDSN